MAFHIPIAILARERTRNRRRIITNRSYTSGTWIIIHKNTIIDRGRSCENTLATMDKVGGNERLT